jgi:hypothetical protein
MDGTTTEADDYYTLLGVRADGVAPVVDLIFADGRALLRGRAAAMLKEHASCELVEIWRGSVLITSVRRD